jgi:hypothetical protein
MTRIQMPSVAELGQNQIQANFKLYELMGQKYGHK